MPKINIFILTNIIPRYRVDFYKRLQNDDDFHVDVFAGKAIKNVNIPNAGQNISNLTLLKYIGLSGEKMGIQLLPIKKLFTKRYDYYVIYGNPRIFTNVILSLVLKALRKNIIIWGQYGFDPNTSMTRRFRLYWWKLFNNFFVYNDGEANDLSQFISRERVNIVGMNNGLNNSNVLLAPNVKRDQASLKILTIGRHIGKNQFSKILKAMSYLLNISEQRVELTLIGNGPETQHLKKLSRDYGLCKAVQFVGEIYDEEKLARYFNRSHFLVQPGGVGLSVVHGFQYGLPMVTSASTIGQMPEYRYVEHLVTGYKYHGDEKALAKAILEFAAYQRENYDMLRSNCIAVSRRCNTERMYENFKRLLVLIDQ